MPPKSQLEITEKLKSCKRRLEEQDEECGSDINRNVRMREEQDHIHAEVEGIESQNHSSRKTSKSTKVRQHSVGSKLGGEVSNGSGHTLESLSKAAISSRLRASGQRTVTAKLNVSASRNPRTRTSGGDNLKNNQSSSSPSSVHGEASPSSSRSSQRIATRRSQRQASGGSSSIAAVAAAAVQAEAAVTATTSQPQLSPPMPTRQDVSMADGTTQQSNSTAADLAATGSSSSPTPTAYNFGHAPLMENIVRVAEAAIAAQNAAKMTAAGSPQQDSEINSNLDPSLLAESSSSCPPSSTTSTAASNFAGRPSLVDTISVDSKTSDGPSSAAPTSASSNLSNNPYLALATNYQRGSNSPTGQSMVFPYPFFYPNPASPATPGSPAYPMPYNPYYYLSSPLVPNPNGVFPPATNFSPPQSQQSLPPPQATHPSPQSDLQNVVKHKRLKAHSVTTKSFSIPMVPRDKNGMPMLPLNVGIMTVISLGTVCMRDHFHTERYIFPVGYEVTRRYLSTLDPSAEVIYHCTILDGGDGPKFQIIPSDRPDKPVIAGTATGAWSSIVKLANAIRNRQHSNSVSGPDFFGLGQNTIKHLIQELPHADKLKDYVWQNFVEGGPLGGRHAAVIPALPEEYDASLPIGAYYPRKHETPNPNLPRGLSYYPQHIIAQAETQTAGETTQVDPVAGPSGTVTPVSAPSSSSSSTFRPQLPQSTPQHTKNAGKKDFLIQEYRPAARAPSKEAQPPNQKRVTRSSAAATNAGASGSTNNRQSKSTSKAQQNQKQAQQQSPMSVSAGPPAVNGDGGTPVTFAGIMKAYPGPHLTLTTGNANSSAATS